MNCASCWLRIDGSSGRDRTKVARLQCLNGQSRLGRAARRNVPMTSWVAISRLARRLVLTYLGTDQGPPEAETQTHVTVDARGSGAVTCPIRRAIRYRRIGHSHVQHNHGQHNQVRHSQPHGGTDRQSARAPCFGGQIAEIKIRAGHDSSASVPGTNITAIKATHATAQTTGVRTANSPPTGHRAA